MEHILTVCNIRGQKEIWKLAEEAWHKKEPKWENPSFSEIMTVGIRQVENKEGKQIQGATCLQRILISEAAYLIWKIRCDRVINEKEEISQKELKNRWLHTIDSKFDLDKTLIKKTFGKGRHKISQRRVKATWEDTQLHEKLPYLRECRVLVGVG